LTPITKAWRCALGLALAGCASSLEDPDRFAFLLVPPDGGLPPAAGMGAGMPGAGMPAAGMGGAGMGAMTMEPPACVTALFTASCSGPACHGAGALVLDLLSPGVSDRLVDQSASSSGACVGQTYVATGGGSLLLDKVGDMPSCGERMPYAMPPLTSTEVQCLTDWVVALGGSGSP
jgi:hypothetical protein